MPLRPTLAEDFDNIMNGDASDGRNVGRPRNVAHDWTDSEEESDVEEAEPVTCSLVLKIVSEPTTPSKPGARKHGDMGEDDGYGSMGDQRHNETYLQVIPSVVVSGPGRDKSKDPLLPVAVQRSTSSSSVNKSHSRSRHPSTGSQFGLNRSSSFASHSGYDTFEGADGDRQLVLRQPSTNASRDGSISPSSLYGDFDLDIQRPNGVNTTEFLSSVNRHAKVMQSGVRELRSEIDNPMRVLDIGQEAIILSGLNKQATDSLKNIKNLYDETKYLKSYLEKMEAKVHYDIAMRRKTPQSPSLLRRLTFLGLVGGTIGYVIYRRNPQAVVDRLEQAGAVLSNVWDGVFLFFVGESTVIQSTVIGLDRDS